MSHAQVLGRRKPLKGNSYIELPKPLALKKCIVNVKNTDDQCFKWAVLSAMFPQPKDGQRVSKYAEIEKLDLVDFRKISYPTPLTEITKFENSNDISISVYGCDTKKVGLKGDEWLTSKIGTKEPSAPSYAPAI